MHFTPLRKCQRKPWLQPSLKFFFNSFDRHKKKKISVKEQTLITAITSLFQASDIRFSPGPAGSICYWGTVWKTPPTHFQPHLHKFITNALGLRDQLDNFSLLLSARGLLSVFFPAASTFPTAISCLSSLQVPKLALTLPIIAVLANDLDGWTAMTADVLIMREKTKWRVTSLWAPKCSQWHRSNVKLCFIWSLVNDGESLTSNGT